jgi:hypothetical protein
MCSTSLRSSSDVILIVRAVCDFCLSMSPRARPQVAAGTRCSGMGARLISKVVALGAETTQQVIVVVASRVAEVQYILLGWRIFCHEIVHYQRVKVNAAQGWAFIVSSRLCNTHSFFTGTVAVVWLQVRAYSFEGTPEAHFVEKVERSDRGKCYQLC